MSIAKNPTGKGGFQERPEDINRNGRPPKGQAIPDILEKILYAKNDDGTTNMEKLLETVITYAAKGQGWAVQFIAERLEGKVKERVEQEVINKLEIEYVEATPENTEVQATTGVSPEPSKD